MMVDNIEFFRAFDNLKASTAKVGIDFETNNTVSLRKEGLGRYLESPDLQVLMMGLAIRDESNNLLSTTVSFASLYDLGLMIEHISNSKLNKIYAHNSAFEMGVFKAVTGNPSNLCIRDTMMIANIWGASPKLEWAAPQLLGLEKMEEGKEFIDIFCLGDPKVVDSDFIMSSTITYAIWDKGLQYCANDAELALQIGERWDVFTDEEWNFFMLTHDMNETGWQVDLDLVDRMQEQYEQNTQWLEHTWRKEHNPLDPMTGKPLNIKSWQQVLRYVHERGFQLKSTDKLAMTRLRIIASIVPSSPASDEVVALATVKLALGGSSLTKLQRIKDLTCGDGRLRYSYNHAGAGQTFRTSGKGVQMQNLKRLGSIVAPMNESLLMFTNEELSDNLRQVFTARNKDRVLMVADLSSVEARILAWLAWEDWKLDAINRGEDLYKQLATVIFDCTYAEVTKGQRQQGKVGELGGGYGMGAKALKDFADKMGIELSLDQAQNIVAAYRTKNPSIKQLWFNLNNAAISAIQGVPTKVRVGPPSRKYHVLFDAQPECQEMNNAAGTKILTMSLYEPDGTRIFTRAWRGAYLSRSKFGTEVVYHKSPSAPNMNKLWTDYVIDPDTKRRIYNKLYGGKLTGVLVQSMARELFFKMVSDIAIQLPSNCLMVGQFHDEVVLDVPLDMTDYIERRVESIMSSSSYPALPIGCEVKHAYRYIK